MQPLQPMPIVSSPMARARETAAPLARSWNCTPIIDTRFSEIPTPKNIPTNRKAWIKDILSKRWEAMDAELKAWREDLLAAAISLKEDTVVFTHFIAINVLVGKALHDERVVVFLPDNASVTSVKTQGASIALMEKGHAMPTPVG